MKLTNTLDEEYQSVQETVQENLKYKINSGVEFLFSLWEREQKKLVRSSSVNQTFFQTMDEHPYLYFEGNLKKDPIKNITPRDITQFSVLSNILQEQTYFEIFGSFLSAVINAHHKSTKTTEEYLLHTSSIDTLLDCIGTYNRAHIRVKGNVGENSGLYMKNGKLTIEGDSSFFLGKHMQGGIIEIFGNTNSAAGEQMYNGTIIIHENAHFESGTNMFGGKLLIMKDAMDVGIAQQGGIIKVDGKVRGEVGRNMQGGKLYLSEPPINYLGEDYSGGKIYVNNKLVMSRWIKYKNKIKELFK